MSDEIIYRSFFGNDEIQNIDEGIISQPAELKINLYMHQLASVYHMEKLERLKKMIIEDSCGDLQTNIGINADMTGYGKTISMVALVLRDKMEWDLKQLYNDEEISTYCSNYIRRKFNETSQKMRSTIVLAGPSIIHQWEKEFSHTPLKVMTITKKKKIDINVNDYDVIIICSTMFNFFMEKYINCTWKRLIFDEPTITKVPNMLRTRAGFIWLISATPHDIYRKHKNCKGFMSRIINKDFVRFLPYLIIKNSSNFIQESFLMPKTNEINHYCFDPIYRAMHGIVDNRISNMIEAGNISGAITALGGKKTDNIIELVKSNKIIELEEIRSKIKIWKLKGIENKIQEWVEKEKKVLENIQILEDRFHKILQNDCSICLEKLQNPVMEPNCQNIFCGKCLLIWLDQKGSCPLCRKNIPREQLTYIDSNNEKKTKNNNDSKDGNQKTKENTIIDIINNKKNGKFIIFSDFDESFEKIRNVLDDNKINFVEINGSSDTRKNRLEKFREGKINVIFLNSKTDSGGINLLETTDIIIYHNMNEHVKTQIIGRANRIGRIQELFVHNLISG